MNSGPDHFQNNQKLLKNMLKDGYKSLLALLFIALNFGENAYVLVQYLVPITTLT